MKSRLAFALSFLVTLLVLAPAVIRARTPAQSQSGSKPFDLIAWNGGQFIYGVDYYPEAEGPVDKDAEMMQAAGINFVRMAEFAWAKMEPTEGHYDFAWLDQALKVLNAHGIKAVLGTPSASPPAWLMAKYPDIAAMNDEGVRYRYGSRRNYCLNNPDFLAAVRGIVTAMAEHYQNHPGVLGWQIDNELGGPDCYDSLCRAAFQKWCRTKYGSLDAVNNAWGTIFWGHTYSDWAQIPLPWNTLYGVHNPSLELDYHRYFSDATRDFLVMQADILRQIAPGKAITHNEMGLFDNIDYSHLNTALDFVAWDNYPMIGQSFANYAAPGLGHDLTRGSKNQQNFMVMEQEGGMPGWTTFWGHQAPPDLYRVWAYQAIAHGADGVCYFRWRTSRYGTEQYWQGVLDQDSFPNARYAVVKQMGGEVTRLEGVLEGTRPVAQVALLVSPDTRWAFHIQPLVKGFDYNRQLHRYYDSLRRSRVNTDVVFPQGDLSPYKVVVAPSLFVVTPELARKLADFVQGGGSLVLTYRSGVKDEHNVFTDATLPGPLATLAGVAIHDYDPQVDPTGGLQQEIVLGGGQHYPARVWFDVLTPSTAETLATYGKGYYATSAAVTRNDSGKGRVYYVGTEPDSPEFYDRFLAGILQGAGISPGRSLPDGVEMAVREGSGRKIVFLLNYTDTRQSVDVGGASQDALTGSSVPASVEVPEFGVRVLVQ
ncbi:MAG TPA: beta-galactosidase [Terriglobia bacterium]|jgi:beta-galactosidase|nr:beta-galactosidase [Terriglobia bacterium]